MARDPLDIERDDWGRPLIINPLTKHKTAYTRISTVASTLDDPWQLIPWKVRNAVTGFMENPELWDMYLQQEKATDKDVVVEEAMARAGANEKREWGSAVHTAVEAVNRGELDICPDFLVDDIKAYRKATEALQFAELEAFGVVHSLAIAGSWDAKVVCPDGKVRVADLKTGRYNALACRVQLAAYAMCENYPGGDTLPVEQDWGIVISLPGKGKCELYRADLEKGRNELQLSMTVRQARSYGKAERKQYVTFERQEGWLESLITSAPDIDACRRLWAEHRSVWTSEHTTLVNARMAYLEGMK